MRLSPQGLSPLAFAPDFLFVAPLRYATACGSEELFLLLRWTA